MKNWSIFVIIFGIVILGVGLFTAQLFALGFHASSFLYQILLVLGIFFPLSFLLSYIVDHNKKCKDGTFYYPIVNTIAGIMFYFFLSAILLSILIIIYTTFEKPVPTFYAQFFAAVSIVFGILGTIQSRYTKIIKYNVNLTGAPSHWNTKRVVLLSDTHFGLINHKKFSDKIVNNILKLKPDFVIHAGDFYDGPKNNTALITESWKNLTKEVSVFYTPGNHEHYGDYEGFITSIENAGITTLINKFIEYQGVQIAGISYSGKSEKEEAREKMINLGVDKNKPLILINHPPTFHDSATTIGTNLMVSGHTHRGQFWPNNYITQLIYKRFSYGLNKKENLTAITTSGVGTAGPPIRLFNPPELVILNFTTEEV